MNKVNTLGETKQEGEQITSKGSRLGKLLTNVGNKVGVTYKGIDFVNAEHAYQTWKSGQFDDVAYKQGLAGWYKPKGSLGVNKATNFQTMVDIITDKLEQHPELVEEIDNKGGSAYILKSTHIVTGDMYWESSGQNKFIEALNIAYTNVKKQNSINKLAARVDSYIDNIDNITEDEVMERMKQCK
jgi:hypothetical protein